MTPETALQDAIVAVLVADPGVFEVVAGAVYDEVPSDDEDGAKPPYIELGPVTSGREELGDGPGWEITLRLYAYSTGFGRRGAWKIGRAAESALEGVDLDLAEPFRAATPIIVQRLGDVIEPPNPKAVFLDVTAVVIKI